MSGSYPEMTTKMQCFGGVRRLVLSTLVTATAVSALLYQLSWATFAVQGSADSIVITGASIAPAAFACTLAMIALWAVLAMSSPRVVVALSILGALLAVLALVVLFSQGIVNSVGTWSALPASARILVQTGDVALISTVTPTPFLVIGLTVVTLVSFVTGALTGTHWAARRSRYTSSHAQAARPTDAQGQWDSLSDGVDPTAQH